MLWILGDLVGLPFLAAQLIHMMREDESDAARIDAELDAQQAQAGQPSPAPAAGPAPEAPLAEPSQLRKTPVTRSQSSWWETDPRFTGRFNGQPGLSQTRCGGL